MLAYSIKSILRQDYNNGQLEILIVDNGSVDDTKNIVASFLPISHYPIHYVYESKCGLSHARNCGIKHANGDVVIFIDDDAFALSDKWVQQIMKAYKDPNVGCAGGNVELVWQNRKRPEWLHDLLLIPLGLTQFNFTEIVELRYPFYPWGCNISFRKDILNYLNGFSPKFGRKGSDLSCNEEIELCLRLRKMGVKIVSIPNAVVGHFVLPSKLNKEWFKKSAIGQGLSDAAMEMKHFGTVRVVGNFIRKVFIIFALSFALPLSSFFRVKKWFMLFYYKLICSWFYLLRVIGLK
jgi:glycosyltransferase involved in cell wall biosynthesis